MDRGPEPVGVRHLRERWTQGWVQFYRHNHGDKPGDSYWRNFHEKLYRAFCGLCAYCEELCKGEVEHFRPKSQFPELVYEWSNWLFACHDCNLAKGAKWLANGYIDPCGDSRTSPVEQYFDYDVWTAEMLPRIGLDQRRRVRALKTIEDLQLNGRHHLRRRLSWLTLLAHAFGSAQNDKVSDFKSMGQKLTARDAQFSSLVRAWLAQKGIQWDKAGDERNA